MADEWPTNGWGLPRRAALKRSCGPAVGRAPKAKRRLYWGGLPGTRLKKIVRSISYSCLPMTLPHGSMLKIGDCEVDPAVDEITRAGTAIKVEPRATRVLLYLAERAGQVISVEELLDKVWADVVVTPDSVYTTIGALRRALGDDGKESRYIVNVPRRGYRLVAPVSQSSQPVIAPPEASAQPPPAVATPVQIEPPPRHKPLWVHAARVAVVLAVLGYLAVEKPWVAKPAPAPVAAAIPPAPVISDKSIAVLPFLDMSEKKDQEYFSDGLSEELIDRLTKVPELKVPARTSSFYFKGKQATISEIGKALGVAHVLEGSVRKSGRQVRITVQLIRANNGYHLWSQTYYRKLDDIFRIQDEIAGAVVSALKVSLLADGVLHEAPVANMDAYSLRQQARFFRFRAQKGDIEKAVALLRKAVQLDPESAVTWAELARALYSYSAGWQLVPWRQGREPVLRAVEHALALDDHLAKAHVVVGWVKMQDWDWPGARAATERARTLDPGDLDATLLAADLALISGNLPEAIRLDQLAAAQDPLSHFILGGLVSEYVASGRLADAEAAARRSIDLRPTAIGVHAVLGEVLVRRGDAKAGLAEIERELSDTNRSTVAWAYQYLGRNTDADAMLARIEKMGATSDAMAFVEVHAMRGEVDAAFAWLERGYRRHDYGIPYILTNPDLNNLHDDPRWKAFVQKLKLLE